MVKITDIQKQKKNKHRYSIFIDGEFFGGMEKITVLENRLKIGEEIDLEELNRIKKESDAEHAFNKAAGLITKTPKTKSQLKIYLKDKGYEEDIIDKVMQKLIEYGYINDKEYVKLYIDAKKSDSGNKKIRYELQRKGVSDSIIDQSLSGIDEETAKQTIIKLTEKYIKGKILDLKLKKNLAAYLYARGFEWEEYIEIINGYFEDDDE